VLFESAAISKYIAAKAGSPLLPLGDLQKVARFEQAMSIQSAQFEAAFLPIVQERLAKPLRTGVPPDEGRVTELAKTVEAKLAAYETLLAKHKYLAGDELTLADLFHLPHIVYAAPQGFTWFQDKEKYPNLAR
jgi:glutathione S-transferase